MIQNLSFDKPTSEQTNDNIQLLVKFENIAIKNKAPPIASIKMSPVLSLDSYFLSGSDEVEGGVGKRNFFDFSRRIAD